jgi:hypothetical protein
MPTKSIPVFTATEAAMVLRNSQPRLWRAIRKGKVQPDFCSNNADLFLPETVRQIQSRKHELFPSR